MYSLVKEVVTFCPNIHVNHHHCILSNAHSHEHIFDDVSALIILLGSIRLNVLCSYIMFFLFVSLIPHKYELCYQLEPKNT
jgi:hypothetical protein